MNRGASQIRFMGIAVAIVTVIVVLLFVVSPEEVEQRRSRVPPGSDDQVEPAASAASLRDSSTVPVDEGVSEAESGDELPTFDEPVIAGMVTDPDGEPIVNANVMVVGPVRGHLDRTDDNGRFALTDIEPGVFFMDVKRRGYIDVKLDDVMPGDDDLHIVMQSLGMVEGRVVDAETGEPIPRFRVALVNQHDPQGPAWVMGRLKTVEDAEGRFSLTGLTPGLARVFARSWGYDEAEEEFMVASIDARHNVTLRLQPANYIFGTVTNTRGEPLPRAEIYVGNTAIVGPNLAPRLIAVTDHAGEYRTGDLPHELAGIDNRKPIELWANHPEYTPSMVEYVPGSSSREVSFRLSRGGIVTGTVYVGDKPVGAGHEVRLGRSRQIDPFPTSNAVTDDRGTYAFEGVVPGEALVSTFYERAPSNSILLSAISSARRYASATVTVREGREHVVDLRLGAPTAGVEGNVTRYGVPLDRFSVQISFDGKQVFTEESARGNFEDGYYFLDGLPEGPARMTLWGNYFFNHDSHYTPTKHIDLQLQAGKIHRVDVDFNGTATVTGQLDAPAAEDWQGRVHLIPGLVNVAGMDLEQLSLAAYEWYVQSDATSASRPTFSFEEVEAGEYTILAFGMEWVVVDDQRRYVPTSVARTIVRVGEGETVNVTIPLQ